MFLRSLRSTKFPLTACAMLLTLSASMGARAAQGPVEEGAQDGDRARVRASLVSDVTQVGVGTPFTAGVKIELDDGWHVYWKNAGDTGLATELVPEVEGASFGPLQWPAPAIFRSPDGFLTSYGYAEEVLLFSVVTPDASTAAGTDLQLNTTANLLVCKVDCIPADLELTLSLPVGQSPVADEALRPLFAREASRVPPAASDAGFAVRFTPGSSDARTLRGALVLESHDGAVIPATEPDFFIPEAHPGFERVQLREERAGHFALEAARSPDAVQGVPVLTGVLRLGPADAPMQRLLIEVPLPATGGVAAEAPAARPAETSVAWALLLALLGGALLNLMPCVFPVLALKAYGFTRTVHEGRGRVVGHALAYTGGILASMLVLALVVLGLRAAGAGVGWGFQFQEPLFVAAVSGVLVAFCLNLFGVFQVSLGNAGTALTQSVDARHGLGRSAGEGVLAVVLATPCSAPMLGTAVGFALAAGPATTVAIFLALGLGLALPFGLLVMIPGLAKLLPRPGAWMEHFKHLLGFALLGTTLWLVWVMGGLVGVDGIGRMFAFLLAVAIACWIWGLAQSAPRASRRATGGVVALALVGIVAGVTLRFPEPDAGAGGAPTAKSKGGAMAPWSEAAVQEALAAGRPAFVDLTADWCLTCKFNERTVLASPSVAALFAAHDVALFVGDFTRRDASIAALLAAHGKAGVPLYLLYDPARPSQPELLPELLTESSIRDALARLGPPSPHPEKDR